MPRAVSMIGIRSIVTHRKTTLTLQRADQPIRGAQFMCVLHLRQNNPVQPRPHHRGDVAVAPFRRPAHSPEHTVCRSEACRIPPLQSARVAAFSLTATASSKSRMTPSAARPSAFSTRRAWLPGANSRLLIAPPSAVAANPPLGGSAVRGSHAEYCLGSPSGTDRAAAIPAPTAARHLHTRPAYGSPREQIRRRPAR